MLLRNWKLRTAMLAAACLSMLSAIPAYAEAEVGQAKTASSEDAPAPFIDVPTGFWAADSIRWARSSGIVDGYPDGTFHPDQPVKEEEFLKMLVSAYEKQLPEASGGWQEKYYAYAKSHSWEALGLLQEDRKSASLDRFGVARLAVNAAGSRFYTSRGYVDELYRLNWSQGRTDSTYEGYDGRGLLTRAEAVTFLRRMHGTLPALKTAAYPAVSADLPTFDTPTLEQQLNTFVHGKSNLKASLLQEEKDPAMKQYLLQRTGEGKSQATLVNTLFRPADAGFPQWEAPPTLYASADLSKPEHLEDLYGFLSHYLKDDLLLTESQLKAKVDAAVMLQAASPSGDVSMRPNLTVKLPYLYMDLLVQQRDGKPSRVNVWIYRP